MPDRASDVEEATITAGQILQSLHGKLQPGGDWRMEVTDEFGHPLHAGAAMSRLTLATNALGGAARKWPQTGHGLFSDHAHRTQAASEARGEAFRSYERTTAGSPARDGKRSRRRFHHCAVQQPLSAVALRPWLLGYGRLGMHLSLGLLRIRRAARLGAFGLLRSGRLALHLALGILR